MHSFFHYGSSDCRTTGVHLLSAYSHCLRISTLLAYPARSLRPHFHCLHTDYGSHPTRACSLAINVIPLKSLPINKTQSSSLSTCIIILRVLSILPLKGSALSGFEFAPTFFYKSPPTLFHPPLFSLSLLSFYMYILWTRPMFILTNHSMEWIDPQC